jgi:predicted metalloendopeptidase
MKRLFLVLFACGAAVAASAQTEKPLTSFPYTPGLDVASMDKAADPCVDFYQYSCGGWMKNNPIPADQARWSVYGKLYQDNQQFLWGILDQLSKQTAGRNANQQKIGDYFGACMDEAAVNRLGAKPLQPYLDQIAAMQSTKDLPALLARLHTSLRTNGLFFNFGSNQDFENSQNVIAFAEAGGLGLPDRDYYTKSDDRSVTIRNQYVGHVAKMFELLGDKPDAAKTEAAKVMEIETALAKASLTRVERRDPYKQFHKVDFKGLQAMTPDFDWSIYVNGIGLPAQNTFNVTQPALYAELDKQLKTLNLADIKTYLRWHTAHAVAPLDEPRHQAAGARKAARHRATRSAIPTNGATTVPSPLLPDDFCRQRAERADQFENQTRPQQGRQAHDRSEWDMTPPTVNAYYSWQMNDINFPAGVLQPPLYDPRWTTRPTTATPAHHRPRTHPRLRRRRPPVRRQRQSEGLVDHRRRAQFVKITPTASSISMRSTSSSTTSTSTPS